MWNPIGPEPETIWEVLDRQKDIQYSSRVANHIARQLEIHRLRHVIRELAEFVPEEIRGSEAVRALAGFGCLTRMRADRTRAAKAPARSRGGRSRSPPPSACECLSE
jgi:NTE family protein